VSAIGTTTHLGSTLNNNVIDNQVVNVQSLHLGVALGITKNEKIKMK
jgi:hypothetical protein